MSKLKEAYDELDELQNLLSDRIQEGNKFKDSVMVEQANHAFILYRSKVWKVFYILCDLIEKESKVK
jgi:hypothetical protein